MNKWTLPLGATLGLLVTAGFWFHGQNNPALAKAKAKDGDKEKRTVSTTGAATVKVRPDSARLFFGVAETGDSIKAAREKANASANKVTAALKGAKVADLKMKTTDVQVDPIYTRPPEGEAPKVSGYRVTHSFTVLAYNEDADKLSAEAGRMFDLVLENGATNVQRISFFRRDETAARHEAMTKAVQAALANVKALASGANVTPGEVTVISAAPDFYWGRGNDNVQAALGNPGAADETSFVAGDLEITCRVNVTCAY
jgi:hypothetical protein